MHAAPHLRAAAGAVLLLLALPPVRAAAGCFNGRACPELRGLLRAGLTVVLTEGAARELRVGRAALERTAASVLRSNFPRLEISEGVRSPRVRIYVDALRNFFMAGDARGDAQAVIRIEVRRLAPLDGGLQAPAVLWEETVLMAGPVGAIGANVRSRLESRLAALAADWKRANRKAP